MRMNEEKQHTFGEKPEEEPQYEAKDPEELIDDIHKNEAEDARKNTDRAKQIQEAREVAQAELSKFIKQDFKSFSVLGRNLIGLSFIMFGVTHFINVSSISYLVPSFIPFAALWVLLTGTLFITGGVCIVIQKYVYKATTYLSYLIALLAVIVYVPNLDLLNIFQNAALIGALLLIADKYKD